MFLQIPPWSIEEGNNDTGLLKIPIYTLFCKILSHHTCELTVSSEPGPELAPSLSFCLLKTSEKETGTKHLTPSFFIHLLIPSIFTEGLLLGEQCSADPL